MAPTSVSDKTFGPEVLGSATPVLVEFTSAQAPVNASLGAVNALQRNVKIARVDVDRSPELKKDYAIRGLPTLVLFKHGKPVARTVGSTLTKSELEEWIDGALILALATRRASAARAASEFTLANGLRVVVIPDRRLPVVTHLMTYLVGAADELKDFSGLATLAMNLTFKMSGDLAEAVEQAGGEMNANISRAATMYWHRVPAVELKLAMQSEARRMSRLDLSEQQLATERNVVLEQLRLNIDNEPPARLIEKIRAALFRVPSFRSPPKELASEITHLTRADIVRFHDRHYAPNNAILAVAGDVTQDEVQRLAEETYGAIPANPDIGESSSARPGVQPATPRVMLEDAVSETAVFRRNYAVPGYGSAAIGEAEALDVLTAILAGGIPSRLYRRLVIEDKVATDVGGTYSSNPVDAGEIALLVVSKGGELRDIEAAVDAAIEDIRDNGVDQAELRCAKKILVANRIYAGGDQFQLAHRYASAVALGYAISDVENWTAAISRVSADDVRKVAKAHVIARRSVTGWLAPRPRTVSRAAGRATSERRF